MAQRPAKTHAPSAVHKAERRVVATNRKAKFDYHIGESFEAGIVLVGPEVKGLRGGSSSIAEAFARFDKGELWLVGMHIPEYFEATYNNHETKRKRKLLLKKAQLKRLEKSLAVKGTTLVPLEIYFNERGIAKLKLAVGHGKQVHDKRQDIKKREHDREMRRFTRRGS